MQYLRNGVNGARRIVGMEIHESAAWNESVKDTNSRFKTLLDNCNFTPEKQKVIADHLALGAVTFDRINPRALEAPPQYVRQQNPSLMGNPYYWGGGYYRPFINLNILNLGHNPYHRSTWNNTERVTRGSDGSRFSFISGSSSNESAEDKKGRHNAMAACAIASIAIANIATLAATVYYWVMPAVSDARQASKDAGNMFRVGPKLRRLSQEIQVEGQRENDRRVLRNTLYVIGLSLERVGNAENKAKFLGAIAWSCLATSVTGAVHATVSAIALAAMSEALTATASAALLDVAAFCAVSCSPPILVAIAVITAVGIMALHYSRQYQQSAKFDAGTGANSYRELDGIIARIPTAPLAEASSGLQSFGMQNPSAYVPYGSQGSNNLALNRTQSREQSRLTITDEAVGHEVEGSQYLEPSTSSSYSRNNGVEGSPSAPPYASTSAELSDDEGVEGNEGQPSPSAPPRAPGGPTIKSSE